MTKIYKVIYSDIQLFFIAEDRDHLMTLMSTNFNTVDYSSLAKNARIEQVAGFKNETDNFNFYRGLI